MRAAFAVQVLAVLLPLAGLPSATTAADAPPKPNIVFILADDLGYGDIGCYGATKVKTPNLDRLAREGRRFSDAHSSAAVCTPTRYAVVTGESYRKSYRYFLFRIVYAVHYFLHVHFCTLHQTKIQ